MSEASGDRASALRWQAVRSGTLVAVLGIVTCLPFYLVIYHLQARGQSAAAVDMSDMHMDRMGVFWSFPLLQASGIAALIWAYLGIGLGLLVSGRPPSWWPLTRPQTDRLHRQISLLVIALIVVHALATAFDAMGDSLRTVFLPGQESWTAAVLAYNLGIFALYLAVLIGPTYYLRRRIGTRWWMIAHRAALAVYIMSLWHTLLLGADFAFYSWLRALTWIAQVPLLVLLIRRVLKPRRRGASRPGSARDWLTPARYWLAGISAAAVTAIVVLVDTGHADLPRRVGSSAATAGTGANWLPAWLGITLAVLLVLAGLAHLRHLAASGFRNAGWRGGGLRVRLWHGAHVLMAAGMIDMVLPLRHPPVSAGTGQIVFAAAAAVAAGLAAARWRDGRATAVLAALTGADLAVMAAMFGLAGRSGWLTLLLCAWLTLEAAYWASGRLAVLVAPPAGPVPARPPAPASATASSGPASPGPASAPAAVAVAEVVAVAEAPVTVAAEVQA